MESRSLKVVEKQAYEGVQYEKPRRSQENHCMGNNLREKYSKNRLKRVHMGPPRIRKDDIVSCNSSSSQSRLYSCSRLSRKSPTIGPDCISTISRKAHVPKLWNLP